MPPRSRARRGEQPKHHAERGHPYANSPVHGDRFPAREIERCERKERARGPDGHERTQGAADQAEHTTLEERRRMTARSLAPSGARHGELVLALRRAREQNRGEIDHQHQREKRAGGPEDDECRTCSGDDIGFESDGVELQAPAVEVACVDRLAGGFDCGCYACGDVPGRARRSAE